ncbi:glycosyltransferase [Paenibacillus sp. MAHUQ-46]|uniref:Glycosyltransferase n=1 Tax=Paenibacillus roseus TaxID=2798579 RepID=A0A934J8L4_9BACL|nr:glycosyltransferase [Paenibacillus roseus]MBJ6363814.1 glycosyltransferase [Paenibacillus roseus]
MPARTHKKPKRRRLYDNGKEAGYKEGWEHGRRDGACKAILESTPLQQFPQYHLRVLYVPQGFEAIDTGIIGALRTMVTELHVVDDLNRMYEMASLLRPDLVVVLNGLHIFPANHLEQIDAIRALHIKTVIWFVDDPYSSEDSIRIAPHYDIVLTHELGAIAAYQEVCGGQVHYMPLAVHHEWFKPTTIENQYTNDVCFIGQGFWNRIELFDAIAPSLSSRRVIICGGLWDRLKNYDLYGDAIRPGWMPVQETIRYYNSAKIVVNLHRTTEPGSDNRNTLKLPGLSINPRTYEISACATLQMVDIREDLSQYYKPGVEIETFASPSELESKIAYYLEHEDERRTIALRGLKRTLQNHTFSLRVREWLNLIMKQEGMPNGKDNKESN